VPGLAIWLPVAAVLSISPRLAGMLRRLGEFLATVILAKLVMVITLATGAAFITAGVFDHDWMQVISGTVLLLITATEPFLLLGFLHWMQPYMLSRGHGFAREALATAAGSGLGAYEGVRWGIRHVQRFDAERTREERRRHRGPDGGPSPGSRRPISGAGPASGAGPDAGSPPAGSPPRPPRPNVPPPPAAERPSTNASSDAGESSA